MRYVDEGVRDVIFPSDNDEGIPFLDPMLCADMLDYPIVRWGRLNRSSVRHARTLHFYTDDYKFSSLWSKPTLLAELPVVTAVECNYSIAENSPRAVVLWRTFQKRWLARYWQLYGVRVVVDVNVPERYWEENMLGVPLGWSAYATRGYNGNTVESITDQYFKCLTWSGRDNILFLVVGGGASVGSACLRNRWVWLPEDSHLYDRRKRSGASAWAVINRNYVSMLSRKRPDTPLTDSSKKRIKIWRNILKTTALQQ